MAKLGALVSVVFLAGALTFASLSEAGDPPCVNKAPKTEMVKAACAKGGQKAVKDAMKAFNKQHKIKSCNQCHTKLAPSYELKKDGLQQFQKLGGK